MHKERGVKTLFFLRSNMRDGEGEEEGAGGGGSERGGGTSGGLCVVGRLFSASLYPRPHPPFLFCHSPVVPFPMSLPKPRQPTHPPFSSIHKFAGKKKKKKKKKSWKDEPKPRFIHFLSTYFKNGLVISMIAHSKKINTIVYHRWTWRTH